MQDVVKKEIKKEIRIKLENPSKIKFIITNSGETCERVEHSQKIMLTKGILYYLPITENIDIDFCSSIKIIGKIAENLRVLNIKDGLATIETVIHGYIINDKDLIGIAIYA